MSKKEKLWLKIKNNPKIIRFDEIDRVLKEVGFECRKPRGGSSHCTYTLNKMIITIPYKKPYVKEIYIRNAIGLIEKLGY